MQKQWRMGAVLLSFVLLFSLAGCGRSSAPSAKIVAMEDASIREAVLVADPEAAVDDIFLSLVGWDGDQLDSARLSASELKEIVGVDSKNIEECYAYRSDPLQGLADVVLLKPSGSADREELRKHLLSYQYKRISEFENYDILNAFEIAQNAVVYDQGDYLVLLMLSDNAAGQDIIDRYIPQ